jgi:hypothetical protein
MPAASVSWNSTRRVVAKLGLDMRHLGWGARAVKKARRFDHADRTDQANLREWIPVLAKLALFAGC